MPTPRTRREFLRSASVFGFGLFAAPSLEKVLGRTPALPANEKLSIGVVGVSGRGASNLDGVSGQNIAALCDVDQENLYGASKRFEKARLYRDFRKLVDEGKDLDAVVVSTPDHTHAVASMAALKAGKHVYCEKPLAHSVFEAHTVAAASVHYRRATQMGTQIHAESNYRRVVELVQSGAIGPVTEAHAWVGKTWSGGDRPAQGEAVPTRLDYDLWLGPAPERPYHSTYLPANWRRWWDFGGGTLGDMGCHYLDCVHWALGLTNPVAVEAEGPPVHPESTPEGLIVHYEHPARGKLPPVKVHWYDGGKRPKHFEEKDPAKKLPEWGDGILFVGEQGMLLADYGRYVLLPEEKFKDFKAPAPFIPDSIGHYEEWFAAIRTGAPTTCNFVYSGALSESVLLGNVAYRIGKRIEWSRSALKVTNLPEANWFIRREYRAGWSL